MKKLLPIAALVSAALILPQIAESAAGDVRVLHHSARHGTVVNVEGYNIRDEAQYKAALKLACADREVIDYIDHRTGNLTLVQGDESNGQARKIGTKWEFGNLKRCKRILGERYTKQRTKKESGWTSFGM